VEYGVESQSSVKALDIVYTFTDLFGEALFARREVARRAAQICRAVKLSTTWAEFRKAMPAKELQEIEEGLDEVAPDDAAFSPDQIGWGDDGWYPGPWPPGDVFKWLDAELWQKYGCECRPNPDGEDLYIPPGSAKKIIRALRAQGHHVAKSTNDLPDWISLISS